MDGALARCQAPGARLGAWNVAGAQWNLNKGLKAPGPAGRPGAQGNDDTAFWVVNGDFCFQAG